MNVTTQVEAALQVFTDLVKTSDREWDPRHFAMTKSEFKFRLNQARKGKLKPLVQVAEIDRGRSEYIFEIKYDFNAIVRDLNGERAVQKARTRLYISEPMSEPDSFVGLHMHDKPDLPGDNPEMNRLQNIEIDIAIRYFDLGSSSRWNLENADLWGTAGAQMTI